MQLHLLPPPVLLLEQHLFLVGVLFWFLKLCNHADYFPLLDSTSKTSDTTTMMPTTQTSNQASQSFSPSPAVTVHDSTATSQATTPNTGLHIPTAYDSIECKPIVTVSEMSMNPLTDVNISVEPNDKFQTAITASVSILSANQEKQSTGLSPGMAGGLIGGVIFLVIIIAIAVSATFYWKQRRKFPITPTTHRDLESTFSNPNYQTNGKQFPLCTIPVNIYEGEGEPVYDEIKTGEASNGQTCEKQDENHGYNEIKATAAPSGQEQEKHVENHDYDELKAAAAPNGQEQEKHIENHDYQVVGIKKGKSSQEDPEADVVQYETCFQENVGYTDMNPEYMTMTLDVKSSDTTDC